MRVRTLAAGLTVAAVAVAALAHETWMTPSTFSAKVGDDVRFDLTSGMSFPRLESPIKAERVSAASFRLDKHVVGVLSLKAAERSLVFHQAFPKDGVATVWLDLKPKNIELTDDKVEEYLDEIDATDEIRSVWSARRGHGAWKETYTKHAKTFVAIGSVSADRSWADGVGQALEIVPVSSPLTVGVGDSLAIELRLDGKRLSGLSVGLRVEGAKAALFRTTDGDGRAAFPMTKGGRAMLFAVRLVPVEDGRSWTSDFCTLTFEIHR